MKDCFNCTKPECDNCIERESNRKYCKNYYERHKEVMKERTRRNRYKKRIEQYGYEMALYI